ncbi:MAG: methionine adenosyltransferase [Verrucomicrobia bacterium]|nr:MAG: methionine adenosyltransferase [Verrucomicrobiota bacterium]
MSRRYIFSSESVTEGHPDKVCDTISDYILDACLEQDPLSRVACETLAKGNLVVLAGEITANAKFDFEERVRAAIRDIGYVNGDCIFHADTCRVIWEMSEQSRDIKQGVDSIAADGKATAEQGAGDQGLMFGFACNETLELMPAPISFAHKLGRELTRLRKSGEIPWLRPDGKTQVSIEYDGYKPVRATTVVVSSQHTADVKQKEVRETLTELLIKKVMPAEWLDKKTTYLINPTGRFVIGGPEGDAGITGRKIICDTYGMGRWIAKNVVAAGLADRCEVQFAYAIGHPEPVSVSVDTFCTGKVDEEKLERAIWEVFNFKPAEIIKQLNLLRPIYRKTTNYGHFGRVDDVDALTWERTGKADELKRAAK